MGEAVTKPLAVVPLQRLVRCLWDLGWRYWMLQNACIVDPGLALRIADAAENEAKLYRDQAENSNTVEWWASCTRRAEYSEAWAALVRKCHAEYSANAELSDLEPE